MNRRGPAMTPWLWAAAGLASAGAVVVTVRDGGATATAALGAVALALAALALHRRLVRPTTPATRQRTMATDERRRLREAVPRRSLLVRGVVAVAGIAGLGSLAALWRYGPRPSRRTGWADGVRLVEADGAPLLADDLPVGGITTVWPEADGQRELAAVVVLRLAVPLPDADGPVADVVAYSRVCTHAGCPVALFRADDATLYCPCHQATFDARAGAEPVFGPASRPLPRLPVGVDADGYLVARGDLDAPPGPLA